MKNKSITFDKKAQSELSEEVKERMRADRKIAELINSTKSVKDKGGEVL
jgi:hypothetical protein